ncbi:MAG: hypothetical protein Q9223_002995 [Gallowayella weberi]
MIAERIGDIFDSPPNSVLIHACNTKGSWGKGVAAAFKKYVHAPAPTTLLSTYSPSAFQTYNHHCTSPASPTISLSTHQKSLLGTTLLIPPFPISPTPKHFSKPTPAEHEKKFWIACLFTSIGYGKTTDPPSAILNATERAIQDLYRQIHSETDKQKDLHALKTSHHAAVVRGEEHGNKDLDIETLSTAIHSKEKTIGGEMRGIYSVRINSGLFGVPWRDTKGVLKRGGIDIVVVRRKGEGSDDEEDSGSISSFGEAVDGGDGEKNTAEDEKDQKMEAMKVDGVENSPLGEKSDGVNGNTSKVTEKKQAADTAAAAENGKKKGVKRKHTLVLDEEKDKSKRQGGRQTKLRFGKREG